MPSRTEYEENAALAIAALFPKMEETAQDAIVFLVVDFLMSLDGILKDLGEISDRAE